MRSPVEEEHKNSVVLTYDSLENLNIDEFDLPQAKIDAVSNINYSAVCMEKGNIGYAQRFLNICTPSGNQIIEDDECSEIMTEHLEEMFDEEVN